MGHSHSLVARESVAATAFARRWSLGALQRIDPELHRRLIEQQSLWHEARVTGTDAEIVRQGEAMCRGWIAAVDCLEAAREPELRSDVRLAPEQAAALRAYLWQVMEALGEQGEM